MASFLDFLFPKRCVGCGRFGSYLCHDCRASQVIHSNRSAGIASGDARQVCPVCEKPAIDGKTHSRCGSPLSFDGATFLFVYKPPISGLIKKLKYNLGRDLQNIIVDWAVEELVKRDLSWLANSTLIPIPLHELRANWRGFNQAEILGKPIAKRMGWNYRDDILVRHGLRKPQTEVKGAKKRLGNVRGIFSINPNSPAAQEPSCLLFDDVWTTGSTMKEAAKVLKRAGAKFVWGMSIAR